MFLLTILALLQGAFAQALGFKQPVGVVLFLYFWGYLGLLGYVVFHAWKTGGKTVADWWKYLLQNQLATVYSLIAYTIIVFAMATIDLQVFDIQLSAGLNFLTPVYAYVAKSFFRGIIESRMPKDKVDKEEEEPA